MRVTTIVILSFLIAVPLHATQGLRHEEELETETGEPAWLEQATLLLDDAEASNRHAALQMVVHQALRGATMPSDVERLVVRATADSDPEVAALAARALDRREHPPEPELGTDGEIRVRADTSRLEWATEVLSRSEPADPAGPRGRSATDRLAAAHILVHLASERGEWSADLEWLVRRARQDSSLEIAHLAEKVLARYEARPMDPTLLQPASRSQEPPGARLNHTSRAGAMYAGVGAPDAGARLSSLQWVVDIALTEGADSDPRILNALVVGLADPDPRIASFARFALDALTGDENALGEVHVDQAIQGGGDG